MTTKSPGYTLPRPDALDNLLSVDPASNPSKDDVLGWLMAEINLPRVAGALSSARSVNSWLYSFWLKVHEGELSPGEALAGLQAWAGENADLVDAYTEARPGYFARISGAMIPTRSQVISRARSLAMSKAFAKTKEFPHGPGQGTGKTIACFVETATQRFWVGRSGTGNHVVTQTPAYMTQLLSNVGQVEDWAVGVCAEVDCMKQALVDKAHTDDLVYYCFTWNAQKSKWTGKTACGNCRQWLAKLPKPQ
ncbi:hypothetical protein [Sorangium sp. So ce1389]|uniref:hypothetical protein n=1 Tax=Sorangium sp. So ce1389 TaxID=3133336 RepID=UPI003F5F3B09